MTNRQKYTLTSFKNNITEHPDFLSLKNEIEVIDLITFYYYLLYPNKIYEGEVHNYYELYVCLSGKASVISGDKEYKLNEKEFLITSITPKSKNEYVSNNETFIIETNDANVEMVKNHLYIEPAVNYEIKKINKNKSFKGTKHSLGLGINPNKKSLTVFLR